MKKHGLGRETPQDFTGEQREGSRLQKEKGKRVQSKSRKGVRTQSFGTSNNDRREGLLFWQRSGGGNMSKGGTSHKEKESPGKQSLKGKKTVLGFH